jgi:hypothetical protein
MRKRGYKFVTVSELLAAGKPEIVSTCYDRRPGDTNRYDVVQLRRKTKRRGLRRKWPRRKTPASSTWAPF